MFVSARFVFGFVFDSSVMFGVVFSPTERPEHLFGPLFGERLIEKSYVHVHVRLNGCCVQMGVRSEHLFGVR